ncbi:MAG: hypothetical protein WBM95_11600, partial [Robiginitalea sp.]
MRNFLFILLIFIPMGLWAQSPWLTGFKKPAENPILQANSDFQFFCPVRKDSVSWQRADVFNPGAVVR